MSKKYLMKGLTALALIVGFTSCVKDVESISPAEEAEKAKENAELQLGLQIPEGQSWNMSTQVTANVNVSKKAGETYRVTVYSNNPLADGKGVFLTRGTINNGETFTGKFTCGSGVKSLYVGLTDSKGYTVYKQAKVENGRLYLSFGNPSAGARRSYTINGDVYNEFTFPTQEELAAAFPTSVPADAKTDAELEAEWKGKYAVDENGEEIIAWGNKVQMWDLYAIYFNMVGNVIKNIEVTEPGEYTVGHSWANPADRTYNVYINIGAGNNLTLKRNGAEHVNFYIMSGNVTIDKDFGQCGGIISVASGATVNDQRKELAHNDGIKVYNRGVYNATNTTGVTVYNSQLQRNITYCFDIGNNASFYNEGSFVASGDLSYSAGAGNTSYFYNMGDNIEVNGQEVVKFKAPSMTMNSTCHFITNGTVEIDNETTVTQAGIVWVNNGKYTTGSLKFSAHNGSFHNYCQLIVTGTTTFTDGSFNMNAGSYMKTRYGIFNNFAVDMADNSMVYVTDGTKWGLQGQGTFQGFRAAEGATAYVVLGGAQQYVPAHNGAAFHLQGAGLTAAISNMKFYEGFADGSGIEIGSTWNDVNYSTEVTAEALAGRNDGRITWDIHNANVTDIEGASVTEPAEGQCSATIEEEEYPIYDEPQVYSYAFEDQIYNGDYDMNDIVLKVTFPSTKNNKGEIIAIDSTKLQITMVAAGATFKIKAFVGENALFDGQEIHDAFGVNQGVMVNTGNGKAQTATPVVDVIDIPDGIIDADGNADFSQLNVWIWVNPETGYASETKIYYLTDKEKPVPYAVMIPTDWRWPLERICVTEAYPGAPTSTEGVYNEDFSFAKWAETPDAQRTDAMREWFKYPVIGKTMTNN